MPIASVSKDNGDWQPVNAKGKLVDAHLNSTRSKDAVQFKNAPKGGYSRKELVYGYQYKHRGAHQRQ